MSSSSSARHRAPPRLSVWLARRFGSFVPRNSERSTSSSTPRHRAQALVSVKVHRQRVECTDICPHEPHLLLAGSDDLLAICGMWSPARTGRRPSRESRPRSPTRWCKRSPPTHSACPPAPPGSPLQSVATSPRQPRPRHRAQGRILPQPADDRHPQRLRRLEEGALA